MDAMMEWCREQLASKGEQATEFKPYAEYHDSMDMLTYLGEDCAFKAQRVDEYLTLFWHPTGYAVGIKLKGFRYVFGKIKDRLGLEDSDFIPLMRILEAVIEDVLGGVLPQDRAVAYGLAKTIVKDPRFQVSTEELLRAAA